MENLMETIKAYATFYGIRIIGAIAIIIIGRIVTSILIGIVGRMMRRAEVDETLTKFIARLAKIALLTFIIIAALATLGVQTTSFVVVIGAAGLAIGFALQGSLSNLSTSQPIEVEAVILLI